MALPEHILLTLRLRAALCLGSGGAVGHSAACRAGSAGRRSALRAARTQLSARPAGRPAASLAADSAWFLIGRRYGHHVLRILCKLSLEPTTCVRRTQDSFGRRRGVTVMIAKFVPGLSTLAPPVAGQNGMGFGSFLFFDGIGAMLWLGALLPRAASSAIC
jgi:hypothetical protein